MKAGTVLLVVMEPGARLPRTVDEARRRLPEHVVMIAGGTASDLALRVLHRIEVFRGLGARIERAVLVLCPGSHASSRMLGRTLVAGLQVCGGAELLLTQDGGSSASARGALFDLASQLLQISGRIPIRVSFDAVEAAPIRPRNRSVTQWPPAVTGW